MDDLISRQAAIDALADYIHNVDKVYSTGKLTHEDCMDSAHSVLDELPSAQPNAVPRTAYEQAMFERDTAIKQLAEIGKGLGEKMDDVERIVRCGECKHFGKGEPELETLTYCMWWNNVTDDDGYCYGAERREE